MSSDLERQVVTYSSWLERTHGLDVRPPAAASTGEELVEVDASFGPPGFHRVNRRFVAPLLLAAAVIVIGVVVVTRSGDERGVVTTPSVPAPTTTTVPPSTSAPVETAELFDRWQEADAERTVLAHFGLGSNAYQIGAGTCADCFPNAAWAPLVFPDGRYVIADTINARWIIGEFDLTAPGKSRMTGVVGYGGATIVSQPVVDDDGRIYALQTPVGFAGTFQVVVYDETPQSIPADLSEAMSASEVGSGELSLTPDGVLVDGRLVAGLDRPVLAARPEVTTELEDGIQTIVTDSQGLVRRWTLPAGYSAVPVSGLPDGSTLIRLSLPNRTAGWVHILASGDVIAFQTPNSAAANGEVFVASDALVQLEAVDDGLDLVAYALPLQAAPKDLDPFAGWTDPPVLDGSEGTMPTVLPDPLSVGPIEASTTLGQDLTPSVSLSYTQLWARDGGGVLRINSAFIPASAQRPAPGEVINVSGWPSAAVLPSTAPFTFLRLSTGERDVTISSSELDRQQLVDLAGGLRHAAGTAGWLVTGLPNGYVPIAEGWTGTAEAESLAWTVDGAQVEVFTVTNTPDAFTPVSTPTVHLTDVNGVKALLIEDSGRVSVAWSPASNVVTRVGLRPGTPEQALALARSLHVVDPATFDAATTPITGDGDGCSGIFC